MPTPVLQISASEAVSDERTAKLNNMNKPTDTRPNISGVVGSMSEV